MLMQGQTTIYVCPQYIPPTYECIYVYEESTHVCAGACAYLSHCQCFVMSGQTSTTTATTHMALINFWPRAWGSTNWNELGKQTDGMGAANWRLGMGICAYTEPGWRLLLLASIVRCWLVLLYGRKSILWQNAKHIYLFTLASRQRRPLPLPNFPFLPAVCMLVHVRRSRLVLRHLPSVYSTCPTEYMKKHNEAQTTKCWWAVKGQWWHHRCNINLTETNEISLTCLNIKLKSKYLR